MFRKSFLMYFTQVPLLILAACYPNANPPDSNAEQNRRQSPAALPTVEMNTPQPSQLNHANLETIRFAYDSSLAAGVTARAIPASVDQSGFVYDSTPTHIRIDFVNPYTFREPIARFQPSSAPWLSYQYPAAPQLQPQILIYPVDSYNSINQIAGERIEALTNLLDIETLPSGTELPVLPTFNSAQDMRAQARPLDFQNGHGVRFIARYSQEAVPLVNPGVFYTFQGITEDGQFYVSAFFPLHISILPDEIQIDDWDAFSRQYQTYLTDITGRLEELGNDDFEPKLGLLDDLVQSIVVLGQTPSTSRPLHPPPQQRIQHFYQSVVLSPENAARVVEISGWGEGFIFDPLDIPSLNEGQIISDGQILVTFDFLENSPMTALCWQVIRCRTTM